MKNRPSKKQKIILAIIGLTVVLISWWAWGNFGPNPLGDKLEYLGKKDYGCVWICDSQPGTMYYYETGMTPKEVTDYFKKASPQDTKELARWIEGGNYSISLSLASLKDQKSFQIDYHN